MKTTMAIYRSCTGDDTVEGDLSDLGEHYLTHDGGRYYIERNAEGDLELFHKTRNAQHYSKFYLFGYTEKEILGQVGLSALERDYAEVGANEDNEDNED